MLIVFNIQVSKPKAIAPLLIWGGSLLAGVIAEEAIEMGIRHFSPDGKKKSKSKAKKIATEVMDEVGDYGFEMFEKDAKRKADGSLEVYPSANDRAKLAKKVADEFDDVIEMETLHKEKMSKPSYGVDYPIGDPLEKTSVHIEIVKYSERPEDLKAHDKFIRLYNVRFTPIAFAKKTKVEFISSVTGRVIWWENFEGGLSYKIAPYSNYEGDTYPFRLQFVGGNSFYPTKDYETNLVYNQYINMIEKANSKIHYAEGLVVPESIKNVYPAPKHLPKDYELPNKGELSNKPVVFKNVFPPIGNDVDISWNELNQMAESDSEFQNKFEQNIDTYLENGDINNNTYNTVVMNNYYTDKNYDEKVADVQIDIDNNFPVPVEPGEETPGGEVEPLNRGLLGYAKQTYEYLADSIDGALASLKDLTDSASGVVHYLNTSMSWLPASWRMLFGSAFIVGVVAHFLRR